MKFNKFVNNYSDAILLLYKENSNKEFINDIKLVFNIFSNYSELLSILNSKIISKEEKKKIIDTVFKDTINEQVKNFLFVLVDHNIFFYLLDILKNAINKINNIINIKQAKIETSFEISENKKKQLINALRKKYNCKIEYEFIIKPELIGGLVITIDDNKIDGSIINKINLLRKKLMKN